MPGLSVRIVLAFGCGHDRYPPGLRDGEDRAAHDAGIKATPSEKNENSDIQK